MKKLFFVFLFSLTFYAVRVNAQATGTSKLVWDQIAPDLVTANSYIYKYYPDSSLTGTSLNPIVCTGTASPFTCSVSYPAFTPGNHTLTVTASNAAGESLKSIPFPFTFVVIPAAPTNIRIQ
jgi:hypothetical protein